MRKNCENCKQAVWASRIIGAGTIIAVMATLGFWVLAIPLYQKRCPICGDTNWAKK